MAVALVEDATDVAGRYVVGGALQPGVLCYKDLGDEAAPPATTTFGDGSGSAVLNPAITKAGTFRLVVIVANTAANAQDINAVVGGATSNFHFDSDNNNASGTLNTTTADLHEDGAYARRAIVTAVTPTPSANWRYGDTPSVAVTIQPSSSGTTMINPKNIKFALSTNSSGSTRPKATRNIAVNTSGVANSGAYNIDTDFAANDTAHFHQLAVNAELGDATTPTGEKPALFQAPLPSVSGLSTSQLSWVIFNTDGHVSGFENEAAGDVDHVRSSTATLHIASGIRIYKDSAGATAGVGSFSSSAYTTIQDLFKRTGAVNTTDAIPFLEAYLRDGYGGVLNAVDVTATVRTQDGSDTVENTNSTLTTDSNGRIRWNYTISASHAAFNRFVKPAATRVTGSHVSTGPDSVASPPATFSNIGGSGDSDYDPPFPAYPKKVRIAGREYGSLEPTGTNGTGSADVSSVFGANSEVHLDSIWTGLTTSALLDSNGVPTGPATRSQTLGAGSLRAKTTSLINESTGRVINVGEFNPKTVGGKSYDLAGAEVLKGRRAVYNSTTDAVIDAGTDFSPAGAFDLDASLGYATTTNNNSLDTIAPPIDPATMSYYNGFADTSAVRGTFTLTSLSDVGFTSDSGNYGHKVQAITFYAVDLSLKVIVVSDRSQGAPNDSRRITCKVIRVLPDNTVTDAIPDIPLKFFVFAQDADAGDPLELIGEGSADPIPGPGEDTADWEFTVTPPIAAKAVKIYVTGSVGGSRIPDGGELQIQVGWTFDGAGFATGGLVQFK